MPLRAIASRATGPPTQTRYSNSHSRLTLDHYAQVVTELGEAAAKAMGERFLRPPRDGRAMDGDKGNDGG
jgi:hypothetical protein